MDNNFTTDIEDLLEKIRLNSVSMAEIHRAKYFQVRQRLQYYRLPTIIISTINSIIAVSLQTYIGQGYTSIVNCLLSMVASIIVSIEMYYGLSRSVDEEISLSKEYYLLSVNVFKMLQLERKNRNVDGRAYLDEIYSNYMKLYENSALLNTKIKDSLTPIPHQQKESLSTTTSLSSLNKLVVGSVNCEIESNSSNSSNLV